MPIFRSFMASLAALALGVFAGPIGAAESTANLERATGLGRVAGFVDRNGAHAWLGIPYARPPEGGLRWLAPRAAQSWDGVRPALRAAPPCSQPARTGHGLVGREDCLYLNIHAPADAGSDRAPGLPVMVWIHGGANLRGDGAGYDGGVLASRQRVIVVTINYRLGVFGWFTHPALLATAQSAADRSGNFGTLDQIMALRWVRQHIAAFGGDPGRVTLFGESAGGSNVLALLTAPLARGLFQRAIVQSGSTATVSLAEASHPVGAPVPGMPLSSGQLLEQLVRDHGVDPAQVRQWIAAATPATLRRFLRARSPVELQAAIDRLSEASGESVALSLPTLFRDGAVLPADGIAGALAAGRYQRMPVMIGSTRDEFTVLLPMFAGQIAVIGRKPDGAFSVPDKRRYRLAASYLSRLMKAGSVDALARLFAANGHDPVFAYRFDWDELAPAAWLDGVRLGATHGLDVPFVFGHRRLGAEYVQLPLIKPESDAGFHRLSAAMMSYWAAFAANGNPGSGRGRQWPLWEPWTADGKPSERFMILDTPGDGGLRMSDESLTIASVAEALATDPGLVGSEGGRELIRQLESLSRQLGLTR